MKIIKKGHPTETWTYDVTCKGCWTEFEFLGKEGRPWTGDKGMYYAILCPVCGKEANVERSRGKCP